ncbi:IS1/IS1595 family N-terminal zinc-binding domain-containing protein [Pseudocalidococcus azoricus]
MNCLDCQSTHVSQNGHRGAKQNYLCGDSGHQFIDSYSPKGYPDPLKGKGLKLYVTVLAASINLLLHYLKFWEIPLLPHIIS